MQPVTFRMRAFHSMFQDRVSLPGKKFFEIKVYLTAEKRLFKSLLSIDFFWTLVLTKAELCKLTNVIGLPISKVLYKYLMEIHSTLAASHKFNTEKNGTQFKSRFPSLSIMDRLGWIICFRDYFVHGKRFSSIYGLDLLYASSVFHNSHYNNQKCL